MSWRGKLLAFGQDAKTVKSHGVIDTVTGKPFAQAICYLAPADISGGATLCPNADIADCKALCLYYAGNGRYDSVQQSRIRKANWFKDDQESFMHALHNDICNFEKWCKKKGFIPVIRPNGTSDIRFENIRPQSFFGLNVFEMHPNTQFLDYTKLWNRLKRKLPDNYHLTWSYSGASKLYSSQLGTVMAQGMNAAVVFEGELPEMFEGYPVIDGDKHDLRMLDPKGVIVGLKPKGHIWRKVDKGFVVREETTQSKRFRFGLATDKEIENVR